MSEKLLTYLIFLNKFIVVTKFEVNVNYLTNIHKKGMRRNDNKRVCFINRLLLIVIPLIHLLQMLDSLTHFRMF